MGEGASVNDRPEGVGDDWVRVDCANPPCDQTVWVPSIEVGTVVIPVCSAVCAKAVVEAL